MLVWILYTLIIAFQYASAATGSAFQLIITINTDNSITNTNYKLQYMNETDILTGILQQELCCSWQINVEKLCLGNYNLSIYTEETFQTFQIFLNSDMVTIKEISENQIYSLTVERKLVQYQVDNCYNEEIHDDNNFVSLKSSQRPKRARVSGNYIILILLLLIVGGCLCGACCYKSGNKKTNRSKDFHRFSTVAV